MQQLLTHRLDNLPVPLYDGLVHGGIVPVPKSAGGDALLNGVVKVHYGPLLA